MADAMGREEIPALFEAVAEIFEEKKEELCAMDANMGDGDLGLTMCRGYGALPNLLRQYLETEDIGKMLRKAGMDMAFVVPSTMGTLMASGLMAAGKALKGKAELGSAELCAYLTVFAQGIAERGKCERGDRTILDALGVAAERAEETCAADPDTGLAEIMEAAIAGARDGVEATKAMLPKFGKAAVFSAKAKGIPDQGAVAGLYLLEGMNRYISART